MCTFVPDFGMWGHSTPQPMKNGGPKSPEGAAEYSQG